MVNKTQEITIQSADQAYDNLNLKQSRKILTELIKQNNLNSGERCDILRKLAHQDWKYYRDYRAAMERLEAAASTEKDMIKTLMLRARIEKEAGNFKDAMATLENALKISKDKTIIPEIKQQMASTVYKISIENLKKSIPTDSESLRSMSTMLIDLFHELSGSPVPSKTLLGISLLLNDGPNVLKAWQSYFHIADISSYKGYLAPAAEVLQRVCAEWKGNPLSTAQNTLLIKALASSRMYEFAHVYNMQNPCEYDNEITDILKYSAYLDDVRVNTNEYYRSIAIGMENEKQYKGWLRSTHKELWQSLSFTSGKKYSEEAFLGMTEKHFGARGFTGSTGNYSGYVICLGHIINRESKEIEQYGYKGEFTYTQLDFLVSNGYSSWFWEDKAIGGWATDTEIIEIRESYLKEPFNALALAEVSSSKRIEIEKLISGLGNIDKESNFDAYKKSLAAKLRLDAINKLYNDLKTKGFPKPELRLAFLSGYKKSRIEGSIFAHEGRHSIEQKYMAADFASWTNEEREYHAKLSQIIFAPFPKLELSGMIENTGSTGHGLANHKIADAAENWIEKNKKGIINFKEGLPDLAQLYLLTEEQIRECFILVDPLG